MPARAERERDRASHAPARAGDERDAPGERPARQAAGARPSAATALVLPRAATRAARCIMPIVRGPSAAPCQSEPPLGTSPRCRRARAGARRPRGEWPGCRTSTPSSPSADQRLDALARAAARPGCASTAMPPAACTIAIASRIAELRPWRRTPAGRAEVPVERLARSRAPSRRRPARARRAAGRPRRRRPARARRPSSPARRCALQQLDDRAPRASRASSRSSRELALDARRCRSRCRPSRCVSVVALDRAQLDARTTRTPSSRAGRAAPRRGRPPCRDR